jgi:MFS transporter, ACS family, glucarate transporter
MKVRNLVLVYLFLLSMITYVDRVCIAYAGPRMQKDLGLSPDMWGWVVGLFAISYAVFEIPAGVLGDKRGPRSVLTLVVFWWSAFTTLTGMVSNYVWLLVTRFLFGAGESGAYPVSAVATSRWFPTTERARAQGIIWMAARIGGAVSPLLVVPIQHMWGWRASFYIFGFLGVIWGIVWYAWFRDYPNEKKGVSAEELAEIGAPKRGEKHSLPWGQALKSKNLWVLMVMYFAYCYGAYWYFSWLPTYLQKGRGFSEAGLLLSALPFVLGAIANGVGGVVSDMMVKKLGLRWGRRVVAMIGLGIAALFTTATLFTDDKYAALVFLSIGFAGQDFFLPTAWAVCLDIGKKYAGAVTGTMNMAGQFGSFVSSVLFGYITKATGSYEAGLIPLAALLAVSAVLWLRIDASEQLIPEQSGAAH